MKTLSPSSSCGGGGGGSGGGGGGGGGGGPGPSKGGCRDDFVEDDFDEDDDFDGDKMEIILQAISKVLPELPPGSPLYPPLPMATMDWDKVAKIAKIGKTGDQLKTFWSSTLDPNVSRGFWPRRDLKFLLTQRLAGRQLKDIASDMSTDKELGLLPRNTNQVGHT